MSESHEAYVHALRYSWLTSVYDPVVRWTCREKAFKSALLRQAAIEPGQVVLDLACGTGTMTLAMRKACPEAVIVGLDGDEKILEIAKSKAEAAGVELVLEHGLSYDQPYPDQHFDKVLSSFLFHHLDREDKHATLREVFRVLKPGGELHVADWGKPSNVLLRGAFLVVQSLDGFKTTSDNVKGLLPAFIKDAGFVEVRETRRFATMLGNICLYAARLPE